MSKPCIVAVSGVSGTGKTTLISNFEKVFPGCRVVTYTTRPKREHEHPADYHFCTKDALLTLPDALWIKENYGHFYAVTRTAFLEPIAACGIALLPTITSHHETLRAYLTHVHHIGIHLLSPTRSELENRMIQRGDAPAMIAERLREIERIDSKARSNPLIHCLHPSSEDLILQTVLAILAKETDVRA